MHSFSIQSVPARWWRSFSGSCNRTVFAFSNRRIETPVDPAGGKLRPESPESAKHNNATALQSALEENGEELRRLAEVMGGSRAAGEQCLAEAIELANEAQNIGREWVLSLLKRLLVHVTLKRNGDEIREFLETAGVRNRLAFSRANASTCDRQKLRSIPPQRIIASLDVLERTCVVLHAYLQYPVLDCALLLGCPRAWIEPVCASVLTKIVGFEKTTQESARDVTPFISGKVLNARVESAGPGFVLLNLLTVIEQLSPRIAVQPAAESACLNRVWMMP